MFYYVGLTDDPQRRKGDIENPLEWGIKEFDSEAAAKSWKAKYLAQSGYVEDKPGSAGLFGYWYKVDTNLFPCPDCKKLVSPNASSCPNCGKVLSVPVKKKKGTSGCAKVALFVILAFIIIGYIGTFTGNGSSRPSGSSTTTNRSTTTTTNTPTDNRTMGQRNALATAESYLDYTAFSRQGLIEQLEYEGFSHSDAVYGTDHCGANWNQQAVLSAQNYLDYSSFSRQGLIEQLEYEGFTHSQAVYGVDAVGY